jgi:DNA primase
MTDILLTLIEQDLGAGKRMGGWVFWRCPFHAGDETPSLGVRNGRYYCFACEASGDAVDWLTKFRHLPMREALRQVKGNGGGHINKPAVMDVPHLVVPSQDWQEQASLEVGEACKRIDNNSPDGLLVLDYLTGRGLTRATIETWMLGAAWVRWPNIQHEVLAVSIPYLDGNANATAIKYRAIDPDLKPRYIMRKGSKPGLYGLWQELKTALILVEGEINALSIWQALGGAATVLSVGGQTSHLDLAKRLLAQARKQNVRTLVWFDEPDVARSFQALADRVLASPVLDGQKFDANALLQAGVLGDFLKKLGLEVEHA